MPDPADRLQLDAGSRGWTLAAAGACLLPLLLQLPGLLGALTGLVAAGVAVVSWRRTIPGAARLLLALGMLGLVLAMSDFRIGRDTGTAVLAAMLAIKPAETFRLRDARSLLGFALFAPFGTFLLDQGPVSLVLGLAGAVLVLMALQRLAELESGEPLATGAGPRLRRVGKLLALGLPLALAAFWLFPRLASPLWGVPERAMATTGLSDEMSPGDWLDLLVDDSPALRVRFEGAEPDRTQMYWRGPVMWQFDGRTWSRSDWLARAAPAPVEHAGPRWTYQVEVEPTERRQLVALDLPVEAPEGVRMGRDLELFTRRPLSALTRWTMTSAPPARFDHGLAPQLRRAALALPEGFNPRTIALARQWRAEAGDDDEAIVQRALDWITDDFAYSLSTPLAGRHGVDEFLFDQQVGFCEHYAGAYTVLMRAAGIPARVVTGYVGGHRNAFGDYWLVRRSDAHAWVEVWLEGEGWRRVDPTAAVAPERIYDTVADRQSGTGIGGALGGAGGLFDFGDWLRMGWNDLLLGFDAERQATLLRPLGIERLDPVRLALSFALVALLALLWMVWLSRRGERQPDPVLRAWHRLDARYRRLGLGRDPSEPAQQWARRVDEALGGDPGLLELSRRFSNSRYAPAHTRQPGTRQLARDLRRHRPPRRRRGSDSGDPT